MTTKTTKTTPDDGRVIVTVERPIGELNLSYDSTGDAPIMALLKLIGEYETNGDAKDATYRMPETLWTAPVTVTIEWGEGGKS